MPNNFKKYAKIYDIIYRDKNYAGECNFLERIFLKYAWVMPVSILDLACGTGTHAITLAKAGYKVCGVDMSGSMVCIARKKSKEQGLKIDYYVSRMQDFTIHKKFDAVVMFFASIDYLTRAFDLKKTFHNVSKCLKKGGLFIFDFWNGLAVINGFIAKNTKVIHRGDITVKRLSRKRLDPVAQICAVDFDFFIYRRRKIIDSFSERHIIRYFFPEEMKSYLEFTGFKIVEMCPFLKFGKKVSSLDWDVTIIARKS